MERREALRNTALLLGYAVSAGTVTAVLNGCTSESVATTAAPSDAAKAFFTSEQKELVTAMCETILPKTDTPGATEAGVPDYVESMVGQRFDVVLQIRFNEGLVEVDEECTKAHGKSFVECSPEEQLSYIEDLDKAAYEYMNSDEDTGSFRPFFATLKELTWVGFFTSELIGKNYLNYDPVPGVYHGCISIEETGPKAWSL